MRTVIAAACAASLLLAAHAAEADCVYHNGYYDPFLNGACGVETTVPEGCPIHVATPAGVAPIAKVTRGANPIDLQIQTTVVDTISVSMEVVDPFDCACARNPGARSFDRDAVTVVGAKTGDVVGFEGSQLENGAANIAIGPAGPCPVPAWPTQFSVATQCDRCGDPIDPPNDPPGDPVDPKGSSSGCSSTGGAGMLAVLAVVVALVLLDRRQHHRSRGAHRVP